ncbi:uncharacterized protein LOC132617379 [Lycium barbarum]|uniref:uncharacterized protein LOC132617379 n=1 Tax=Lycium barbarum TaxID=112863 RepID=UPI00293F4689|nr:uncharacterized protein LOC132617379 [Lycium barbarum]
MGACASKPNVLNGEVPEVAQEKDVVQEEVKKDEAVIANDDADKSPSLNNEEGKGAAEEKEETSVKASKVESEAKTTELEVEKVVDDGPKNDADEKQINNNNNSSNSSISNIIPQVESGEEVKSETPAEKNVEEVVKPSVESENKTDDEEKPTATEEEATAEKTVEEVKPEEKPAATEDKKIEEKPAAAEDPKSEASSVEKKKEDKPAVTKKGKFWWDK